ncbi:MAG: ATP-dependent helicase C-terminal domain-containing protein, partial [Acidimicrobiia bacterium]
PSGSEVRVDYTGERPVLAVRLQELFGATTTPTLLDGRLPVLLHLLSPARRPVQITDDLAGFWKGSWAEVRKDMAGRYPKHDWPEHPA